ncbi:MAG: hypothetical protein QM296_05525 [Bacillota bacterium]|nr:hypothetical protein [Bacillota bacterium]
MTFLNVCYNKKFYVDNSLENILIGKNGPRIYPDKNNNFTFSDIYKFKKIKFSILIAAVVIISAVYFYLDSYFLLIFLMGMNLYSIMILLVHLKYNEFDLYNEVLTLCIYQNVLNYDFIDALKDVDSFDVNVEMEMELHLKLQILMINNNIQHHLSVSDLGVIADKNFFSLLFLEVLENIYNIKNGKPIEYRYSAYYLEMPFIEEMFIDARKMSYEHDLCGLVNLLPYRLRKMLICV